MDERIDLLQRRCASQRGILSLGGGLPALDALPSTALAAASARAFADPAKQALQYGWPEGDAELRGWLAARLTSRGRPTAAEDLIVTAGAQQALAIAATLLREEVAAIAVPDVCYPGALDAFRRAGLELVDPSIARDARHGCVAQYRMTGTDNPTGAPFDLDEALRLARTGQPLLLDEAYAELVFDGACSIDEELGRAEAAWWIGTFSKTLAPGLRVGWLIAPRSWRKRALEAKRALDLEANAMCQRVLCELLHGPCVAGLDYDRHLRRLRALYGRRARALARAIEARFPEWVVAPPRGGFSMWMDTGVRGSEIDLLSLAMAEGVSFDPGQSFRRAVDPIIGMRLSFSSVDERSIPDAVERLHRAWKRLGARPSGASA